MEDRKPLRGRKILISLVGGTLGSVFFISNALAYGVETHAFLTKEVVDFYNIRSSSALSEDEANFLIDGARHEDTSPRYLNHFYDPVNDQGLNDGLYHGEKSKTWAQSEKMQTALVYKILARSAESTILTANQFSSIKPVYYQTDFTWQKAIDLYARGQKEQALFALGHIVHLIEDASVPDHTRNDAHPPFDHGGSPYENWTDQFSLNNPDKNVVKNLKNKSPILLDSLDAYFDSIAKYSNNNFYSRDSIDKYKLPVADYFKKINDKTFGFKKDSESGDYRLFIGGDFVWNYNEVVTIDYPSILEDYWSLLSTKAVQHGAGVISLFFKEAEVAKAKYELDKARRPYLGLLNDGFSAIFGNGFNNTVITTESPSLASPAPAPARSSKPTNLPSISPATPLPTFSPVPILVPSTPSVSPSPSILPTITPTPRITSTSSGGSARSSPSASPTPTGSPQPPSGAAAGTTTPSPLATPTPSPSASPEPTPTSSPPSTPAPSPQPSNPPPPSVHLLISEVQVAGQSAGDEFIELYNPTDTAADLATWSIQYLGGTASSSTNVSKKNFIAGQTIAAHGFFLIARTLSSQNTDGYTGSITPDLTHRTLTLSGQSGGGKIFLVNDQEKIIDFNDSNIVDKIDYSFLVPPAGQSLERKAYQNNNCLSAYGAGENLGNGCQTHQETNDFELRLSPQPQNTGSPVEPATSSFLKSLRFFSYAPPGQNQRYWLDLSWDKYPFWDKLKSFVSHQEVPNDWGTIVFYYNRSAPPTDDLLWINYQANAELGSASVSYQNWGLRAPSGFKIKYPNCLGSAQQNIGSALILPATSAQCSPLAINQGAFSLAWEELEDQHLLVEADSANFTAPPLASQDFVSVALYAYQPGYEPNNYGLRFLAADPQKHYFSPTLPPLQPPTVPANINFVHDSAAGKLKVSWDKSTDPDTPDRLINYQLAGGDFTATTSQSFWEISVEPGKKYSFHLSSFDNFHLFSLPASASFQVPDLPLPFGLTSLDWGTFSKIASPSLTLRFPSYPFMPAGIRGAILFFLNQDPPLVHHFVNGDYRQTDNWGGDNNTLKISYLPCDFLGAWIKPVTNSGLLLHNGPCPNQSGGILASQLSMAKLASSDIDFTATVRGVLKNGQNQTHEFSASDYLTLGFYQLSPPDFFGQSFYQLVARSPKKIYYQP